MGIQKGFKKKRRIKKSKQNSPKPKRNKQKEKKRRGGKMPRCFGKILRRVTVTTTVTEPHGPGDADQ